MIVVADTSPLNYLLQLELVELLHQLYAIVLVPPEVVMELRRNESPERVREWADDPPDWLQVKTPAASLRIGMDFLHAGEQAAIALAREVHASQLLIDERKGRSVAINIFHMKVSGTLGVLIEAHHRGLVNGLTAFQRLRSQTNFRSTSQVDEAFRKLL